VVNDAVVKGAASDDGVSDAVLRRGREIGDAELARKADWMPVEESVVQRILHNSDFAVAGIGD
jgi:hypothetical protein